MKNITTILLVGIIATSCAIAPSKTEIQSISYGEKPTNPQEIVKGYDSVALKNPNSAKYANWTTPRKVWVKDYLESPFPTIYGGWAVCFDRNARNSYGGYNGFKRIVAIINGSQVVKQNELSYFKKSNVFTSEGLCRNLE